MRSGVPVFHGDARVVFDLDPAMELPADMPETYAALSYDAVMECCATANASPRPAMRCRWASSWATRSWRWTSPNITRTAASWLRLYPQGDGDLGERTDRTDRQRAHRPVHRGRPRRPVAPAHLPFPCTSSPPCWGCAEDPQVPPLGVELISVGFDWERGMAASQTLGEYLACPGRSPGQSSPRCDSDLAQADADASGSRTTSFRLPPPAPAGRCETTYRSSRQPCCSTPVQPRNARRRARRSQPHSSGDRGRHPLGASLTGIMRTASADTTVQGVAIPAAPSSASTWGRPTATRPLGRAGEVRPLRPAKPTRRSRQDSYVPRHAPAGWRRR